MRAAAKGAHLIEFLDRKRFDAIQQRQHNCLPSDFYTLIVPELKRSLEQLEEELQTEKGIIEEVSERVGTHCKTADLLAYY